MWVDQSWLFIDVRWIPHQLTMEVRQQLRVLYLIQSDSGLTYMRPIKPTKEQQRLIWDPSGFYLVPTNQLLPYHLLLELCLLVNFVIHLSFHLLCSLCVYVSLLYSSILCSLINNQTFSSIQTRHNSILLKCQHFKRLVLVGSYQTSIYHSMLLC